MTKLTNKDKTLNIIIPYDVTLRDGAQTPGINLTAENKLRITRKLDELGFPFIEGGWPEANPTDRDFFVQAKGLKLKNSQLVAFGMTGRIGINPENDPGLAALLNSETKILTIFGKSWMLHVTEALKTTAEKNLETIQKTVAFLTSKGKRVFYDAEHFFDGFKDNYKYALKTLEAAVAGGAEILILCDTNGGSTPEFVYKTTLTVKKRFKNTPLGIHAHNDSGLALVNTLAAIKAGVTQVQGTINGAGERTGNVDFCQFLPTAKYKYGIDSIIDLTKIRELSSFVELENGFRVPVHTPYVGENAFTHKGGVHISAMRRNPTAYEHLNPALVGAETNFEHSDQGGGANILAIAEKFGLSLNRNNPICKKLVKRMKGMKVLGDAQQYLLLHSLLTKQSNPFEVCKGSNTKVIRGFSPTANIKVKINKVFYRESAEGNGPINAFDKALKKALSKKYPTVNKIKLLHYRIPDTQLAGTDAEVIVYVEFGANGDRWTSVATGTNQQIAGEDAIIDGYKYYLLWKNKANI